MLRSLLVCFVRFVCLFDLFVLCWGVRWGGGGGVQLEGDLTQDILEEGILDALEDKFNVFSGDGASEVDINCMRRSVLFKEAIFDESSASFEVETTGVSWETDGQIDFLDFVTEKVSFVEEEDEGGFLEPGGVADFVKQQQRFFHAVLGIVFSEGLVVFG